MGELWEFFTVKVINIFRGSDAYVATNRDVGVAPTTDFHITGDESIFIIIGFIQGPINVSKSCRMLRLLMQEFDE
jgi:hypothetical protein